MKTMKHLTNHSIIPRRLATGSLLLPFLFLLFACTSDNDDESYPSLVTEMVMAQANAQGQMVSFTTDDGQTYIVDNDIHGMTANSRIRCLCGYVTGEPGHATVYNAMTVLILARVPSNIAIKHHPTGIASAWLSGRYVNLHLTPKTQGGKQTWGFSTDSVTPNTLGGSTHHLSLYHDQNDDATSYTSDLYAAISLDSITATPLTPFDSIRLSVTTFNGIAFWQFRPFGQ